ncbi:hypothetical protein [Enterocloster citroniae]|uniref:hypothetical protein n=1 Tax=Enterocloster citroniae TaxID=358743 RepID=UPI0034A0EAF1
MKVQGEFKFLGVEKRHGFRDPSQVFYIVGFAQGLDSLRCYVDAEAYRSYSGIEPYSDVTAELEYNPVSGKVALVGIN